MNGVRLQDQSFAEGLERQLVKRALNPNIAEAIHVDPKRLREFEGIGSTLFAKSYKSTNPFSGLLAAGTAGYGQLRGLHELRNNFLKTVAAMRERAQAHPVGSSVRATIEDAIRNDHMAFKSQKSKRLQELGAVAAPRQEFMNTTIPASLGLAGGAAGGYTVGNIVGNQNEQNDVAGAPAMSRLNYLFHPGNIPSTPSAMPGPADPSDQQI